MNYGNTEEVSLTTVSLIRMPVTHLALTAEALLFPHEINSTITESYLLYPVANNRLESLYLKTGKSTTVLITFVCLSNV